MIYNITTVTYINRISCYYVMESVPEKAVGKCFGNTELSQRVMVLHSSKLEEGKGSG